MAAQGTGGGVTRASDTESPQKKVPYKPLPSTVGLVGGAAEKKVPGLLRWGAEVFHQKIWMASERVVRATWPNFSMRCSNSPPIKNKKPDRNENIKYHTANNR